MASCSLYTFSIILISFLVGIRASELSPHFYDISCPNASTIILSEVRKAVANEPRMAASLVRLHFHDCFVNGCDASVLLDDDTTANFTGEKTAFPNVNSIRGFEVVDAIKAALEKECPGIVSCADILAVAARDSVVESRGISWIVPLGRRDSLTANRTAANTDLPGPASNLSALISSFSKKGFTTTEMVILSGAHTFGQARCVTFRPHIYNDTNIDSVYAKSLQANCPSTVDGDHNLADLDVTTENVFDNKYFKNLIKHKGLLHSDQELYNGGLTDVTVALYAISPTSLFLLDFGHAMVKMGNLSPLTGSDGEIRTNCRKRN